MQEKDKLFKTMNGAELDKFSRSCDLVCFSFVKGNETINIHCQCFLRAVCKGKIVTTTNEMYFPSENLNEEKTGDFEWDNFGSTKFDVKFNEFVKSMSGEKVVSFEQSGFDFKIKFENDCDIDIISIYSGERENWRIFKKGNNHCVFYNDFKIE